MQILLVSGAILLTAALYLAPQFKNESHAEGTGGGEFSFEADLKQATSSLSAEAGAQLKALDEAGATDSLCLLYTSDAADE